jgi:hypothetical protein
VLDVRLLIKDSVVLVVEEYVEESGPLKVYSRIAGCGEQHSRVHPTLSVSAPRHASRHQLVRRRQALAQIHHLRLTPDHESRLDLK